MTDEALNRRLSHDPTLRELLEQQLNYERVLVAAKFENTAQALQLQAAEYERRLTVLNHAHEAAVQAQAMTVPREMFQAHARDLDAWKAELSKWKDQINRDMVNLTSLMERVSGCESKITIIATQQTLSNTRMLTWGAALGAMLILLQIALNWYKK